MRWYGRTAAREEIVGRAAILEIIRDERKLSSDRRTLHEPIRQVMRAVRAALDRQEELLYPVKPRVLFLRWENGTPNRSPGSLTSTGSLRPRAPLDEGGPHPPYS